MLVPHNNFAEISANNQPQPENKNQRQTLLVQIPLELIGGRKKLRDSSSPKSHTVDNLRLEVVSLCKVSSSDDSVCVPHNEVSGFSTNKQPDQKRKKLHQTVFVQMTEMEPNSKREAILGARQFPRVQSLDGEDAQACELIQDQSQSSKSVEKNHVELTPAPCSQAEDILENIKQERFEPDAETQPHSEDILVIESPAVKLEKTHGCTQRLIKPNCRQQWKSDPPSQNPTKDLESTLKLSPVQSCSPQIQAAPVNTGQENQSGPSHKAEQAPKQSTGPREHSGSQMLTRTSIGGKTHEKSHLSFYLKASLQDTKPVIGMGSVWECRGMSLETFFLCESCEEILSRREICRHMVTHDHQLKYMWKKHPEFLQMFWFKEDLLLEMKMDILKDVVQELSQRERVKEVDAQCILLERELHEFVRTAPFDEALKILKNIKAEEKPSIFHVPISATQQKSQQHEDQQSLQKSLPQEKPSAQGLKTNQRSDSEAVNKAETSHSTETDLVGGLDVVKDRRSPLDVTFPSTKAEPFVSPVPAVGTCVNPPETCSGLSLQAEVKPAVSQLQRPDPLLQVKQEEEESTYFTTVSPAISPNLEVSPQNECPPTRKRRADMSVETLHRTVTSSSLEDPLPAKYEPNPVQVKSEPSSPPISESPSVNPAVNSTLLHLKEEDSEPKQNQPAEKWKLFADQLSASESSDFKVNLSPLESAPDNAETTNLWATDSSETVESRWQLKSVKTEMGVYNTASDSKCQLAEAMVNNSAPSNSVEGIKEEAPVYFEYENQIFTTGVYSAFTASNPYFVDCLPVDESENMTASSKVLHATFADSGDSEYLQRATANEGLFLPGSVATDPTPGQIQQQGNLETNRTEAGQLPIYTGITALPTPTGHIFLGCYKRIDPTEDNTGHQISFHADPTTIPTNTVAASGAYGQYNQTACTTMQHSGHLSSQAVAGYMTQNNAQGSSQEYTPGELYPSQMYPEQTFSLPSSEHYVAAEIPPEWRNLEVQQQFYLWGRRWESGQ
ncbi:uncharacterized protein [Leuresthes tenuis]|uniref:uncharacterized protein n=1 Tax=Leuresthes tenuis TaxID=355514 RepID=UPI003B514C71